MTESRGARDDSTPNKDEFTFDRPEAKPLSPKIDVAIRVDRDRRASFIMGGGGLPTSAVAGIDPRRNPQIVRGSVDHRAQTGSLAGSFCEKMRACPAPTHCSSKPIPGSTQSACDPGGHRSLNPLPRPRSWPSSQPSPEPSVLRASTISAHWFASGAKGATKLTRSANPPQRARILSATSPR